MAGAQPLLIHSLVEFDELIEACLDLAGARSVLEIGSESGASTKRLLAGASGRGGALWCIEPAPTRELEELDRTEEAFNLVRGASPAALEGIEPCDAYVIDGDHNYWTVSHELEHLGAAAGTDPHPLVILHDVAWPCGRRDLYYSPRALPAEALHPHSWDLGVVPGAEMAVAGGFRGQGSFAVALQEGGARNGVRTAVEDYLDGKDGLRLFAVPAVFGLGVVYSAEAPYA
ncbi:MAG: class I SAM-dependent methyltransferase, partial [Thermoleophilaceae bacterium]